MLSRVSVFFKAGARYNTFPGAGSAVRAAATGGYSSAQHTGLHLTRSHEQSGATLAVTAGREALCYSTTASRDDVTVPLYTLANLTSNTGYRYWELPNADEISRLKVMQQCSPLEAAVELAAKAAFRSPALGVAGAQSTPSPAAKYVGGDMRVETGGAMACVVVAGEGVAAGAGDRLAALVAAEVLAPSGGVQYGGGAAGALLTAAGGVPCEVGSVALCFQDSGLLGFSVVAPAAEASGLVSGLTAAVRALQPSEAAVAAAKARVEAGLQETASGSLASLGQQLLLTGEVSSLEDDVKALQGVSAAQVAKVLKKAFSGKLSVAATGNVNNVPYSDTL